MATDRAGKKRSLKEQRETVGSLDAYTVLGLTWSMVASFREQGPGAADIGRMKRRDFLTHPNHLSLGKARRSPRDHVGYDT